MSSPASSDALFEHIYTLLPPDFDVTLRTLFSTLNPPTLLHVESLMSDLNLLPTTSPTRTTLNSHLVPQDATTPTFASFRKGFAYAAYHTLADIPPPDGDDSQALQAGVRRLRHSLSEAINRAEQLTPKLNRRRSLLLSPGLSPQFFTPHQDAHLLSEDSSPTKVAPCKPHPDLGGMLQASPDLWFTPMPYSRVSRTIVSTTDEKATTELGTPGRKPDGGNSVDTSPIVGHSDSTGVTPEATLLKRIDANQGFELGDEMNRVERLFQDDDSDTASVGGTFHSFPVLLEGDKGAEDKGGDDGSMARTSAVGVADVDGVQADHQAQILESAVQSEKKGMKEDRCETSPTAIQTDCHGKTFDRETCDSGDVPIDAEENDFVSENTGASACVGKKATDQEIGNAKLPSCAEETNDSASGEPRDTTGSGGQYCLLQETTADLLEGEPPEQVTPSGMTVLDENSSEFDDHESEIEACHPLASPRTDSSEVGSNVLCENTTANKPACGKGTNELLECLEDCLKNDSKDATVLDKPVETKASIENSQTTEKDVPAETAGDVTCTSLDSVPRAVLALQGSEHPNYPTQAYCILKSGDVLTGQGDGKSVTDSASRVTPVESQSSAMGPNPSEHIPKLIEEVSPHETHGSIDHDIPQEQQRSSFRGDATHADANEVDDLPPRCWNMLEGVQDSSDETLGFCNDNQVSNCTDVGGQSSSLSPSTADEAKLGAKVCGVVEEDMFPHETTTMDAMERETGVAESPSRCDESGPERRLSETGSTDLLSHRSAVSCSKAVGVEAENLRNVALEEHSNICKERIPSAESSIAQSVTTECSPAVFKSTSENGSPLSQSRPVIAKTNNEDTQGSAETYRNSAGDSQTTGSETEVDWVEDDSSYGSPQSSQIVQEDGGNEPLSVTAGHVRNVDFCSDVDIESENKPSSHAFSLNGNQERKRAEAPIETITISSGWQVDEALDTEEAMEEAACRNSNDSTGTEADWVEDDSPYGSPHSSQRVSEDGGEGPLGDSSGHMRDGEKGNEIGIESGNEGSSDAFSSRAREERERVQAPLEPTTISSGWQVDDALDTQEAMEEVERRNNDDAMHQDLAHDGEEGDGGVSETCEFTLVAGIEKSTTSPSVSTPMAPTPPSSRWYRTHANTPPLEPPGVSANRFGLRQSPASEFQSPILEDSETNVQDSSRKLSFCGSCDSTRGDDDASSLSLTTRDSLAAAVEQYMKDARNAADMVRRVGSESEESELTPENFGQVRKWRPSSYVLTGKRGVERVAREEMFGSAVSGREMSGVGSGGGIRNEDVVQALRECTEMCRDLRNELGMRRRRNWGAWIGWGFGLVVMGVGVWVREKQRTWFVDVMV